VSIVHVPLWDGRSRRCLSCNVNKPSPSFPATVNRHPPDCFVCQVDKRMSAPLYWHSKKRCRRCRSFRWIHDFTPRNAGRRATYCSGCSEDVASQHAVEKTNSYYHSPEYKRLQWRWKCEREGRPYIPGKGNASGQWLKENGYCRGGPGRQLRSPRDVSDRVWRRLEIKNAGQAWKHWLSVAPERWLKARAFILDKKQSEQWRANRSARRARARRAVFNIKFDELKREIRT
jgi:hypothetical protein